jgi:chromosome segregation protein
MKLTRLELSGFKSFADNVRLPFETGVTGIVGPNGCGKSNISDAVRWVLGEQRVRLLRGARMEEVIFQGSAKRRPVNISEVSLVLDNSDDTLPIAYDEVVVTRRLSRSGQSDYLVNGKTVRLKDLHDLLRGTGLASDVGVVIEAQMIDRLLSDRPDERRSLFEDAAGIGVYRDRRISTERRLENTQEDLQRLDDLISEVQTQVRSLSRQRGKAERYTQFANERFGIVITLTRRELARFDDEEADFRKNRTNLSSTIPEARLRLEELEKERAGYVQARATAEARRSELERRLTETRVAGERLEGDINVAAERLNSAASRKTRATEERNQANEAAARATRERDAAAAERVAAESARESVQVELGLRSTTEGDVRERLANQRGLVHELEGARLREAEAQRAFAGELTAIENELGEIRTQLQDAEGRRVEAVALFEQAHEQLNTALKTRQQCQSDEQKATSDLERARHDLVAAREKEASVIIERRSTEETIAQLQARQEALKELERTREGLAPAARALLLAKDKFGEGGVLGPLSDFISTSQADAGQAERLLASWLNAVLVRDQETVTAIMKWHAETQPGPLALLPVLPGPTVKDNTGNAPELSVDSPAAEWVKALLAGMHVGDAQDNAVHQANGAIYLSNTDVSGPLSRKAELVKLADDRAATEERLEALHRAAASAADAHSSAEKALEKATAVAEDVRSALREAQGNHDDGVRSVHRAEQEKSEAEESFQRLTKRSEECSGRLKQLKQDLARTESEHSQLGSELETQHTALSDLEKAQEAARERLVHWQVEEAQVSAREKAATERESRAAEELGRARQTIAALDRETEGIETDTEELSKHRDEWLDTLAERRVTIQQMEAATQEAGESEQTTSAAVNNADLKLTEARAELEALNEQAHSIELALTESAGRRRAMIERTEVEFHKPLSELLEGAPEVEGETEELEDEAERMARALEALGPINPLAVHEHAEETKRLTFLQEQRQDLVEARKSMLQALGEIDATARALFVEMFEQIRENFDSVFHTLFDGGECDVRLLEEADPLLSPIEIFAAPRGKRTQRIHLLSSGERALVALSLLFAIYLTKPAPFCLLDEVDAPLDDANVTRFVRLLDEFKDDTQFIVITHNPRTMQVADAVYGVTMQEPGVSTIVGVRLGSQQAAAS